MRIHENQYFPINKDEFQDFLQALEHTALIWAKVVSLHDGITRNTDVKVFAIDDLFSGNKIITEEGIVSWDIIYSDFNNCPCCYFASMQQTRVGEMRNCKLCPLISLWYPDLTDKDDDDEYTWNAPCENVSGSPYISFYRHRGTGWSIPAEQIADAAQQMFYFASARYRGLFGEDYQSDMKPEWRL